MLTPEQEKWINHLSNTDKIKIVPFDLNTEEKFQKIKTKILQELGEDLRVEHCGATSLGVSGQDEIDVYVPVEPERFDSLADSFKKVFGSPRSLYPFERARFVSEEFGKHIDIFLINRECSGWMTGRKFEKYLKSHPKTLDRYRKLKENGNGLSVREYYQRKVEFINEILSRVENV